MTFQFPQNPHLQAQVPYRLPERLGARYLPHLPRAGRRGRLPRGAGGPVPDPRGLGGAALRHGEPQLRRGVPVPAAADARALPGRRHGLHGQPLGVRRPGPIPRGGRRFRPRRGCGMRLAIDTMSIVL